MENQLTDSTVTTNSTRSTLLTVLCILTWVGCAIGFATSLSGIFGAGPRDQMNKTVEQMDKMPDGAGKNMMDEMVTSMMDNMDVMEKWTRPISIITLGCVFLCAFGAYMMWNLKKTGFYLYTLGELLPIILNFALMSSVIFSMKGFMGTMMKVSSIAGVVIAIVFVLLYARTLKSMKD
jgi:hypothetical protein